MAKKNDKEWVYWIFGCLIILSILWLFYGSESQEFIGLPTHQYQPVTDEEIVEEEFEIYEPTIIKTPRTPIISFDDLKTHAVITNPMDGESNGERITRRIFERFFGKPFVRVRPDFLRNPETGKNLELDGYNEELKIAFEYNGIQHYHFPSYFTKNEEDFKKQLRRDKFKLERCNELGIYLIIIPYSVKHENILHEVWHKLHPDIRVKTVV